MASFRMPLDCEAKGSGCSKGTSSLIRNFNDRCNSPYVLIRQLPGAEIAKYYLRTSS